MKVENQIFEHFDDVYENREQFSMSWAFKDAQEKLNNYKTEIVDDKVKSQCKLCDDMNKAYKAFRSKSNFAIRRQKMLSSIFSNMHGLVNFMEIILSVLLVLVISEISHSDFIAHETRAFSLAVVVVFGFIKVFIEQWILKPRIEAFGWRMYRNSVDVLKGLSDDFVEQVQFELEAV